MDGNECLRRSRNIELVYLCIYEIFRETEGPVDVGEVKLMVPILEAECAVKSSLSQYVYVYAQ